MNLVGYNLVVRDFVTEALTALSSDELQLGPRYKIANALLFIQNLRIYLFLELLFSLLFSLSCLLLLMF